MNRRRHHDDEGTTYDRLYKKRRKVNENQEIEDRLECLIVRVGENQTTTSLESNLEGLASVLEADLSTFRQKVLNILTNCAVKMPEKCTIYSTLVGLLNTKNYNFGGEFVENIVRQFKDFLKSSSWDYARYTLRFLADLVNCHVVSASSLIHCFESLLEVVKEDGTPMIRKDWYVYAVLSCLPWVGRELYEKKEQALEKVLTVVEVYLNKRPKKHVSILRVWSSGTPHPQEEYLDCLWAQIQKFKQDNWVEKHIIRPYLAFDQILCEALQHNVPSILPAPHMPNIKYPMPKVIFRMFDYTDCPEGPIMPGAHSIERYLIEEHLHQVIETYHKERKECATQLMNVSFKAKIPLSYCIVEVIFAELLNLPTPRYIEIVYGSILIELCKAQSEEIPPVLAQAIELFFIRLENMNVACFDRLVSWFSYHLSNFKFHFCWEDWESCINFNAEHPQSKYLRELFLKIVRLSYHQRVIEMVPAQFAPLLPEKPMPDFKYDPENADNEDVLGVDIAQQLITAFKEKSSSDRIIEILKEIPNPYGMEDMDQKVNPLMIDVFVQTILYLGSKSFSHAFAAIFKYYDVFRFLSESEEAQLCILRSIYDLWSSHQQVLMVLIDKLLKSQILECSSVANWIFSKEMSGEFTKLYMWEILCTAINKMSRHVNRIAKELADLKEKAGVTVALPGSESEGESAVQRPIKSEDSKVTDQMIEQTEEKLEAAQADQKNLFLIVFQRFIMILSEHMSKCDNEGIPYDNYWYKWTVGRLQQVFLTHHEQVEKYSNTLETLLFTSDLDPHILETFQQFLSLRS